MSPEDEHPCTVLAKLEKTATATDIPSQTPIMTKDQLLQLATDLGTLQLALPASTDKNCGAEAQIDLATLAFLPDLEQELSPQVLVHLTLKEFHLFPELPIEIRLMIVSPSLFLVFFISTKLHVN